MMKLPIRIVWIMIALITVINSADAMESATIASASLRLNNLLLTGVANAMMPGIIATEYNDLEPKNNKPFCRYISSDFGCFQASKSYPLEMFQVSGEPNNVIVFYEDGIIEKLQINQTAPGQTITIERTNYANSIFKYEFRPINVSTDDGVDFYATVGPKVYRINKDLVHYDAAKDPTGYWETLAVCSSSSQMYPMKLLQWNASIIESRIINAAFGDPDLVYLESSEVDLGVKAYDLEICTLNSQEYTFIANGSLGLRVLGPKALNIVLKTGGVSRSISFDLDEHLLFLCEGKDGVVGIDISDPANPVFLGRFDSTGSATHFLPK